MDGAWKAYNNLEQGVGQLREPANCLPECGDFSTASGSASAQAPALSSNEMVG
jgi:hypothetical protein